nr:hypothetical protein [Thiocystis violacea]
MTAVRVPETAMNQDQRPSSGKDDVGPAGPFSIMETVAVASGKEGATNQDLRFRIARTDA